MTFIPRPHEIYKHFKGNLYQITTIAEHTETGEQLVIYQALYGDFKSYARPLSMFVERVDRARYPEAEQEFRFELQGPDAARQKAETGQEKADIRQKGQSVGGKVEPDARKTEQDIAEEADPNSREKSQEIVREAVVSEKERGADLQPAKIGSLEGVEECQELNIDPLVLEFLDSDSYEQRLNILAGLHHRITDEMITTMAIACDIEINDGDIEERYEALKVCLLTLERYECNRLR